MISNRCARKSLVTNCNSIISKSYSLFLVDSNDLLSIVIFVISLTLSILLTITVRKLGLGVIIAETSK